MNPEYEKNIIEIVNEKAKELVQNNEIINNIVNTTMLKLSRKKYFNNRHNMFRLMIDEHDILEIANLYIDEAPMMYNGLLDEKFNHSDIMDNLYKINNRFVLNQNDLDNIETLLNYLESSPNLKDYQDKIKEKDQRNPEFMYQVKSLTNLFNDRGLFIQLIDMSLNQLKSSKNDKKFIDQYMTSVIDKKDNEDCVFFSHNIDSVSLDLLEEPIESIEKNILDKKSLDLFITPKNNIEFFSLKEKTFEENFNRMKSLIEKGHPNLNKTVYAIFKNHNNIKDRIYHLNNEFLYKPQIFSLIKMLKENKKDILLEEKILEKYQKYNEIIIKDIEKKFPEINKENKYTDLYYEVNDIKNYSKDKKTGYCVPPANPMDDFPQNWTFLETWDTNESLKGMYYINEETFIQSFNQIKKVVTIKNNIENVGYLIFNNDPKINFLKLNSLVIGKDYWHHPKLVNVINESIKEIANQSNSKMCLLVDTLLISYKKNNFNKNQLNELFKIKDVYIIGDKEYILTNKKEKNIFQSVLSEMIDDNPMSIPNTENMVNKLKEIESTVSVINQNESENSFLNYLKEENIIKEKIISAKKALDKKQKNSNISKININ